MAIEDDVGEDRGTKPEMTDAMRSSTHRGLKNVVKGRSTQDRKTTKLRRLLWLARVYTCVCMQIRFVKVFLILKRVKIQKSSKTETANADDKQHSKNHEETDLRTFTMIILAP